MNRDVAAAVARKKPEAAAPSSPAPSPPRWHHRAMLMLASIGLLSLAFAPVSQFYLAWIGLAPWLLAIISTPSKKSALAWGFGSAWAFFLANMWWIWFVTPPGLFALTLYLAIFSGLAGLTTRTVWRALLPLPVLRERAGERVDAGTTKMHPIPNPLPEHREREFGARHAILLVLLIPTIWVAFEWLRGNISFLGKQGLPWLYLGQTQSPLLVMCQIADTTSVLGVSFWVAMINVLIAMLVMHRHRLRALVPSIALVTLLLIAIGAYGAFRLSQDTASPGPTVMVVQSNYKQSNTGEKGAPMSEIVRFHVMTTRDALRQAQQRGQKVDLVVWSETMMPPLNRTARDAARGTRQGQLWQDTYEALAELASEFRTPLLAGGIYLAEWAERDEGIVALDRRNTAYFIDANGNLADGHYDKVHLVPFGEYIPFKETIPPLYRLFIKLGPNYYEEYALTRGSEFTVFTLEDVSGPDGRPVRFVVPICFEDIVPSLVARMLYDPQVGKRADFLVNITNDGWFRANQMPQHLQAAIFRSIEHRVPTARSVNTGISAFVDPLGRVSDVVPADTEGWRVATLQLDRRVAPYTRIGDAFPITCLAATAVAVGAAIVRSRKVRPPAHVE